MSYGTPIDLSQLPRPTLLEQLDYEAIYDQMVARFLTMWAEKRAANPALPEINTLNLETDPLATAFQVAAYREVLLRARINDVALARFLAFAEGANLDHLAAFYDVVRLPGELDDRLKYRVVLEIQGRSTGGPEERYKAIAMATDLRVESAAVYRIGRSPIVHVAIYSTEPDGVASDDLLAKVRAAFASKSVQLVNDTIVVASAVRRVVNLAADIWLLRDAADATVEWAIAALRTAWQAERALGRDLTESWWKSRLMISGVHKIVATTTGDHEAGPTEALSIGDVTLALRGRMF